MKKVLSLNLARGTLLNGFTSRSAGSLIAGAMLPRARRRTLVSSRAAATFAAGLRLLFLFSGVWGATVSALAQSNYEPSSSTTLASKPGYGSTDGTGNSRSLIASFTSKRLKKFTGVTAFGRRKTGVPSPHSSR